MGIGIDSTAAPGFIGPTPPDQQEMTFGEHLQAALQVFAARPLDATEMRDMKAFMVGIEAEVQKKTQEQGAPGTTPGQNPLTSTDTEDYGGPPQNPDDTVEAPYGSV